MSKRKTPPPINYDDIPVLPPLFVGLNERITIFWDRAIAAHHALKAANEAKRRADANQTPATTE